MNEEQDLLERSPSSLTTQRERIEFLAHALAYGVSKDKWSPKIAVVSLEKGEGWYSVGHESYEKQLHDYLKSAWGFEQPQISFLEVFGYVQRIGIILGAKARSSLFSGFDATEYILTPKAIELLDKPAAPPLVFISYRRDESSALGLLIVSRLQAVGVQNPFIDMNIDPGDEWHAQLENTIKGSRYIICLMGKEPFSKYVTKEIFWASSVPNLTFIPVWHSGYKGENSPTYLKDFLESKNAIRIKEESAEEYNNAIILLLNRLGYAP